MRRIDFEDTTITRQPYVTIDNVDYEVNDGTYIGGTDLDADTFNTLQDNIEDALANVGGNEIAISETEPTTETTKLWINSGEISNQASEITNSYSTSTGIGYSANYVNNNVEPKGVVIYEGTTKYANDIMTIPQEYKKLDVYCYSYVNAPAKNIISIDTSTNSTQFTTGAVFALPDAYFVEIELIFKTNRTLRADYCATYPNFASNSATTRNNDNNFYVYKIVGYK